MKNKEEKKKINFEENISMPESIEEIKNVDVVDKVVESGYFEEISKDLSEEEKKHVLKETRQHMKRYQDFLGQFAQFLETPEGKEKFLEFARKKFGVK